MSEKTVSQKIARVFEIVDYFLLIPSLAGLFFGIAMLSDKNSFPFGLAICAVFTIGTLLLIGYFKHSRGRLSEKSTVALWIGTILFNALFFLPSIFYVIKELNDRTLLGSINNLKEITQTPYSWLILWWEIAIGGSIIALSSYKINQKYR
jgi:NADH:ubiquinone oxidoreductase subunit 6 (subunit J)